MRVVSTWRWVALFVGAFALGLAGSVAAGVNPTDEAWFLQVCSRVASGEVLYRDVFFNTTPGSVALGTALVWLLGSDVIVVKVLLTAGVTVGSVAAGATARRLGASRVASVLVVVAGVTLPAATPTAPYTHLAVAGTACCLYTVIRWREAPEARWLVLAGIAVGAAFASKHTLGVTTAAALGLALLSSRRACTLRALTACVAVGAATALLPLLVVALQGGAPKLLEYAVTAKTTYLDVAGVSWIETLQAGLSPPASQSRQHLVRGLVPFLPLLVVLLMVIGLLRSRSRTVGAPVTEARRDDLSPAAQRLVSDPSRGAIILCTVFAAAALANVYPRADLAHFLPTAPLLALCVWAWAQSLGAPFSGPVLAASAGLTVAAALLLFAAGAAQTVLSSNAGRSQVPHFRGALLREDRQAELLVGIQALRRAAAGQRLFVLAPDAGGRYRSAGLPNHTPFDYPLATALGRDGAEQTAREIRAGRFDVVCLSPAHRRELFPAEIVAAIEDTMRPGEHAGTCQVFRR